MSTTIVAQRKRPPRKPATPARTKPKLPAPEIREPELQLDRLPPDPSVEGADIAITAQVRARSLEFETVPNPTVEFPGQPQRNTVWEAQRENLPTPVEPGVTYRNIGIRLKITSVFSDIDRIVAEALGEIPITPHTEDAKPAQGETAKQSSVTPKTDSPVPLKSKPATSRPPLRER